MAIELPLCTMPLRSSVALQFDTPMTQVTLPANSQSLADLCTISEECYETPTGINNRVSQIDNDWTFAGHPIELVVKISSIMFTVCKTVGKHPVLFTSVPNTLRPGQHNMPYILPTQCIDASHVQYIMPEYTMARDTINTYVMSSICQGSRHAIHLDRTMYIDVCHLTNRGPSDMLVL